MKPERELGTEGVRPVMLFDLDYPDPMSRGLDFDVVETLGRRYRRRQVGRMAAASVAGAAVVTLLACGVVASRGGDGSVPPAGGQPSGQESLAELNPPLGPITTLGTVTGGPSAGWSEVAWMSTNKQLCFGVADLRSSKGLTSETCVPTPSEMTGNATTPAVYQPLFSAGAIQNGSILVFGFTRGPVASVSLTTSFGTSANAATVGLAGTPIHGYAVFVATAGRTTLELSDIKNVVGTDASGNAVAHLY